MVGQRGSYVAVSWQILVSVIVGVCFGLVLLLFVGKPHAKAFSISLIAGAPAILARQQSPPTSTSAISVFPELHEQMTILLMGVDSNGHNTERWVATRSDTIMVVSLDPVSKRVGVISIPRDSRIKISGYGIDKINAAHALGGPKLTIEAVEASFGVHIDRFVVVDTQGLKKLFEVVGPVEVLVENRMKYRDRTAHLNVDLEPGWQLLDPVQAEEYIRFRHDARGDLGRIERQQWFVRQVMRKLREPQVVFKLPQMASLAHEYVVTDLSVEDMIKLISFLKDIQSSQIETATLPGSPATIGGGSYWLPDFDASRIVFERLVGTLLPIAEVKDISETLHKSPTPWAPETKSDKPVSVAIKYPLEAAKLADRLETLLEGRGVQVGYKWQAPAYECQHEQIVQNSPRADDLQTQRLKDAVSVLANWPVIVALESRPLADFTLVISPASSYLANNASAPLAGRHLEPAFGH